MNDIVKFGNEFNTLKLAGFNAVDLDLLMLLCAKVKDEGTNKLTFSFNDLKRSLGMERQNDKYFLDQLCLMNEKLMKVTCKFRTETSFVMFVLFPTFEANLETRELKVGVNENFSFLLNDLVRNFTRFELEEFVNLESKYSKNLYRLLKQYRRTGTYKVEADKFRELMDCPDGYTNKFFMRDCVNTAVKELSHGYFDNLQVTPIRAAGRGRPIKAYEFTFRPSEGVPGQYTISDYLPDQAPIKKQKKEKKPNKFNNFQEREYDYQDLEKKLLDN